MTAFRILNQFPVYLGQTGKPAEGGYLLFYETGTTNPKDVYADKSLSSNNGNRVNLDPSGRTAVDVWGNGEYRVRLYASDATLIDEADNVEVAGGDGQTIPALTDGWFLTNNGAIMLWAPVRQLPDPTGQDGKILVAGSGDYAFADFPVVPPPTNPDIVVGTESFLAGISSDPTKFLMQMGRANLPATNQPSSSLSINFPLTFLDVPFVYCQTLTNSQPGGPVVLELAAPPTATGFTVEGDVAEAGGPSQIVNPIFFNWLAIGRRVVP